MNSLNTERTPCFVQTQQGVSIEYQGKYLYSKYNPSKNIELFISNLQILPGTIFLCCSPTLNYGIESLLNKISDNCLLVLCEKDPELYKITSSYYYDKYAENKNIILPTFEELYNLPSIFNEKKFIFSDNKIINSGNFKRVLRIDFSAGTQFNHSFYNELELACINSIKTFWVNRVTLTKFGRKYSHNYFRNLANLPYTTPISNYFSNVTKPIIVCGAGISLNDGINDFIKAKENFFILAVDTAANYLIKNNIIPDGIFIEECQNVILKSFFEINNSKQCKIFAGLSSINNLSNYISDYKQLSYFFTEYSKSDFFNELKNSIFFPPSNPPFGSVGLTTVYYALKFRQSDNIPIYIYGLDFAYPTGITHVKNSLANKNLIINSNKFSSLANFAASFINTDKISDNFYTTPVLKNYADLFKNYFSKCKNLFDSRKFGIDLNLEKKLPEICTIKADSLHINYFDTNVQKSLKNYFEKEIDALNLVKDIFTNKKTFDSKEKTEQNIYNLLYNREYLYLHFIDGYQLSLKPDFLKRIRTEIDFFLKDFERLIKEL